MQITRTSILTGETRTLDLPVTEEQLAKFSAGEMVQKAFPQLSASDREFILSGITEEEWEAAFGGDEEEE